MSLLDVGEAAERLNTSPRFVRRLIQERRIAFVKVGRHVRIKSTELDRFVADGEVSAVRRGSTNENGPPEVAASEGPA